MRVIIAVLYNKMWDIIMPGHELAMASNTFTNPIHCMHIWNVLSESIHLNYKLSMFALLLQTQGLCNDIHARKSRDHHLE